MEITNTYRPQGVKSDEITLVDTGGVPDREIAEFAGYNQSYFGYFVRHFDDGSTMVYLHKD